MKIKFLIVLSALSLSCKDDGVKKPSKLIKEDKMIDIIYDISILEALSSNNPVFLEDNNIDFQTYIYKKYTIDSLQLAENTAFYASDLKKYKNMYEAVEKRIEENKKIADSLLKIKQKEDTKKQIKLRTLPNDSTKVRNRNEAKTFLKKQN